MVKHFPNLQLLSELRLQHTVAKLSQPSSMRCPQPPYEKCLQPPIVDYPQPPNVYFSQPPIVNSLQSPTVNFSQPPIMNTVSSAGCGWATSTACDSVTCAGCGSATSAVRDEVTCAGYGSATFVTTTASHNRPTSDCRTANWFDRFRGVLRRIRLRKFEDMLNATLTTTYSKISPNGPIELLFREKAYLNDVFGLFYGFQRTRTLPAAATDQTNSGKGLNKDSRRLWNRERNERESREKVCF